MSTKYDHGRNLPNIEVVSRTRETFTVSKSVIKTKNCSGTLVHLEGEILKSIEEERREDWRLDFGVFL